MSNLDGIGNLIKLKENFTFKFYKFFDVSKIQEHISKYNDEWTIDTSRQDTHDTHKYTNAYFIVEHRSDWKYGEEYNTNFVCKDLKLWELIEPITKELELIVDGKIGKVTLIKLFDKKNVSPHRDYGDYLGFVRRFHIPIFTNKDVLFGIETTKQHMAVGECWEINNSKSHFVINSGNEDRIHLLIDIMPNYIIRKEI